MCKKVIGFCKIPSSDVKRSNLALHSATGTLISSPDFQQLNEKDTIDTTSITPVDLVKIKGKKETKDISVMEKLAMIENELLSMKRKMNLYQNETN